jgi:predicted transcriptional regulator
MNSEPARVEITAPNQLIERVAVLAAVLGEDQSTILVRAIQDYLKHSSDDEEMVQEIAGAYYDDEISFEELEGLLGTTEAKNHRVLKQQLSADFVDSVADLE